MALIAPSLVAADFARLGEALQLIKEAGASMVHVDVTDGHFTPDITMGAPVVQSLRKATDLVLDVHLLIERPERFAGDFLKAGADRLAVQFEGTVPLLQLLKSIRARSAKAGVAINPSTPVEAVAEVMGEIDFLLLRACDRVLDVTDDLKRTFSKLRQASAAREDGRYDFALEVEGCAAGFENELVQAGADILVTGSDIFAKDHASERLRETMRRAAAARQVA